MIGIKPFLRILIADKRQHLFNIVGFGIGLSVLLLVSLYLKTELSYDKHIAGNQHKYRLLKKINEERVPIFPYIAAITFREQIPELESLCIVDSEYGYYSVNDNPIKVENALVSDSTFISMFDLKILHGSSANLLNEPSTCIISESLAKKMFGDDSAIGKEIEHIYCDELTVQAVFEDLPETCHLKTDLVQSRVTWRSVDWKSSYFTEWGSQGADIYIALNPSTNLKALKGKLKKTILDESPWFKNTVDEKLKAAYQIDFQAMQSIHLDSSNTQWDSKIQKNNPTILKAFGIVMLLVILMVSFNYINLSTASSENKNKLAGLLKSMGATQSGIFSFFFTQTIVIGMVASIFSLLLAWLLLPYFEQMIDVKLSFQTLLEPQLFMWIASFIILVVTLSGLYPAIRFSKSKTIRVLRNSPETKKQGLSLRAILVTSQFVVSIFLIISLIGIRQQIKLVTTQELGFNSDHLVEIGFYQTEEQYRYLAEELSKFSEVKSVTAASNMPCEYIMNESQIDVIGENRSDHVNGCLVGIEHNYWETMQTKLIQGRVLVENSKGDGENALINETAVKALDLIEPIDKQISLMNKTYTIVGVVKDIQYRTLKEASKPVIYASRYNNFNKIAVRLYPGNHVESIAKIKDFWYKTYPDQYLELKFFDQRLQDNYRAEIKQLQLFNAMVAIGLLVLVLGLSGLILFITEKRTKEIGIRKVNGAKISEILTMLNKDFVKWVVIAFVIATPIAFYAMNRWLENFAYKTNLSWWIFALAGFLALGIALLTVSWQSWRAATRNPVEALRYE